MISCQREGNLYIPFLKNVSSFDEKLNQCLFDIFFIFEFFARQKIL